MRLVIVESPYAGQVFRNVEYARKCVLDCLKRGEAPIASHLLYTQHGILDDATPDERRLGIAAGVAWYKAPGVVGVFYDDFGYSEGMIAALKFLETERGRSAIETRRLVDSPFEDIRAAFEKLKALRQ